MPAGVIFRVGGALDPSYKTALAQSVAEAKAASLQINGMNFRGDASNSAVAISSARARKEIDVLRAQQRDLKTLQAAMIARGSRNAEGQFASGHGNTTYAQEKLRVAEEIAKKEKAINAIYAAESALQVAQLRQDMGLKITAKQAAMLKASEAEQTAIQVSSNEKRVAEIMAQEKAAGVAYESEKAAQLAAEDIFENERIAKAAESAAARKVIDEETTAAIIRDTTGAMEWAQIAEEEKTAALAKAAAERVAIVRAEQLTMLKAVAENGAASALGHGGGGGGGISGVVRESLVILREVGRGNMTRVPGSLLLLLQYTGMLNLMMKSEKTEALLAAAAQEKLAQSTARAAMAAEAKVRAAKIAAGISVASPELIAAEAEQATAAATAEGMRAEATTLAAAGEEESANATAANILALEAERDLAVKAAVAETLRARETAAAAATIKASAATTAAAMALMVLPIVLLVAILTELYLIYKELQLVFRSGADAQKEAAEYTRAHTLAIWEEVEAMEKARDATIEATEALKKMNEAKDRSVELAHEAVAAANAEAEAKSKLYDASVKSKLLDVEIAEKKGQITHAQAVQQKAAIESQAVADKAAAEQAKLDNAAKIAADAAAKADQDKAAAQAVAQAAIDKTDVDKSPEAKRRVDMLAAAEKDLSASKSEAEAKAKKLEDLKNRGWLDKTFTGVFTQGSQIAGAKDEADAAANAAASAEIRTAKLKRFMKPDEIAAADALSKARTASGAADTLHDEAKTAATAASTNAANSPAEVAAEQANIAKQAVLDAMDGKKSGSQERRSATERERVGIGAPQVANLQKQTLDVTRQQLIEAQKLNTKIDKLIASGNGANNPDGW